MSNTIDYAYAAFCEERFSLPTDELVAALERRMSAAFPDDYREFLLKYNGGFFSEPRIVSPNDDCPLDRLTFLSGIAASRPVAELTWPPELGLFDDNDPPQIVPIGYTLMGNLIFLITHPDDRGCIGLKKAWSDESFFLADGIESFFALLTEPPLDE